MNLGLIKATEAAPEGAPLTCLRCRQCALLPHTDFSVLLERPDAIVPIHCGKIRRSRPAHIWTPCALANPNHRYENGREVKGDKTRHVSPVEEAFLRALYARLPLERMETFFNAVMRRGDAVGMLCNRLVLRREWNAADERERTQRNLQTRARNGTIFNAAQSRLVVERHARGDWPQRGGNNTPSGQARREALKEEIIEAIAALGPRKTWQQISMHAFNQTPAAQRNERRKHPRKLLKTRVPVPFVEEEARR